LRVDTTRAVQVQVQGAGTAVWHPNPTHTRAHTRARTHAHTRAHTRAPQGHRRNPQRSTACARPPRRHAPAPQAGPARRPRAWRSSRCRRGPASSPRRCAPPCPGSLRTRCVCVCQVCVCVCVCVLCAHMCVARCRCWRVLPLCHSAASSRHTHTHTRACQHTRTCDDLHRWLGVRLECERLAHLRSRGGQQVCGWWWQAAVSNAVRPHQGCGVWL
jgi:hypothetical protein